MLDQRVASDDMTHAADAGTARREVRGARDRVWAQQV